MRIRCFVALNPSVAVARRVAEEVEKAKAAVNEHARVAWVAPANYHLTMRFLGSIEEELVEALEGRLQRVAARHASPELKVGGFGAFPSLERASVLWVGSDGGKALLLLQKDIEGAVVELGFAKEQRPFHPHLTVGRVKESRGPIQWSSVAELGMSHPPDMVVYESRTKQTGSEYIARARVALGKSGAKGRSD
jgi:2'-5' RNA ligase